MVSEFHEPPVLAYDADGTIADAFIVNGVGSLVAGKALSTPEDEAISAFTDGLKYWNVQPGDAAKSIAATI